MILLCWQVDGPITGGGFCASAYCNWKGGGEDEGGLMSSSLQNPRTNLLSVKAVSQWVVWCKLSFLDETEASFKE